MSLPKEMMQECHLLRMSCMCSDQLMVTGLQILGRLDKFCSVSLFINLRYCNFVFSCWTQSQTFSPETMAVLKTRTLHTNNAVLIDQPLYQNTDNLKVLCEHCLLLMLD